FFFSSRRRHTRFSRDWSSDVCSSDLVILIPGVGMFNTGKSWAMSKVSGALYHRAIAVMRGSTALGNFVSLSENESFHVEYWPLRSEERRVGKERRCRGSERRQKRDE